MLRRTNLLVLEQKQHVQASQPRWQHVKGQHLASPLNPCTTETKTQFFINTGGMNDSTVLHWTLEKNLSGTLCCNLQSASEISPLVLLQNQWG